MKKDSFLVKLLAYKWVTDKPSDNSGAGSIVFGVILIGIFLLHISWWICVIIIVVSVFLIAIGKAKNSNG